jgi:hypothetical protein
MKTYTEEQALEIAEKGRELARAVLADGQDGTDGTRSKAQRLARALLAQPPDAQKNDVASAGTLADRVRREAAEKGPLPEGFWEALRQAWHDRLLQVQIDDAQSYANCVERDYAKLQRRVGRLHRRLLRKREEVDGLKGMLAVRPTGAREQEKAVAEADRRARDEERAEKRLALNTQFKGLTAQRLQAVEEERTKAQEAILAATHIGGRWAALYEQAQAELVALRQQAPGAAVWNLVEFVDSFEPTPALAVNAHLFIDGVRDRLVRVRSSRQQPEPPVAVSPSGLCPLCHDWHSPVFGCARGVNSSSSGEAPEPPVVPAPQADAAGGGEQEGTALNRPKVVTVCGSTRFKAETLMALRDLALQGTAVFSVGFFGHADGWPSDPSAKARLDALHLQKIEMSDGIFVVNVGNYIGSNTAREIAYAESLGKEIEYLEPPEGPVTAPPVAPAPQELAAILHTANVTLRAAGLADSIGGLLSATNGPESPSPIVAPDLRAGVNVPAPFDEAWRESLTKRPLLATPPELPAGAEGVSFRRHEVEGRETLGNYILDTTAG